MLVKGCSHTCTRMQFSKVHVVDDDESDDHQCSVCFKGGWGAWGAGSMGAPRMERFWHDYRMQQTVLEARTMDVSSQVGGGPCTSPLPPGPPLPSLPLQESAKLR